MRVACIVLAHRNPEQLGLLLSALRHPDMQIYLHLDARATGDFSKTLARAVADGVVMVERRRSRWGGPELVDATLDGLSLGVRDGCRYFVLVSGQDLPLHPVGEILDRLRGRPATSYVEHWPLPTSRWRYDGRDRTDFYTYNFLGRRETCIPSGEDVSAFNRRGRAVNALLRARSSLRPRRTFPSYLQPIGGGQWWNLSLEAARYVLKFIEDHPDYRAYHQHTMLPDELFFQSILVGTPFADGAEIVSDTMRFMRWDPARSHPSILTMADLPAMVGSEKWFGRKFDLHTSREVVQHLVERWRR